MTQEQLSQELHIARPTITKYEAGDRMPTTENLSIIANYFGVTIDDLAGIKTDIKEAPLGSLSEEEEELIRLYRECSDRDRAKVVAYADGILANRK